MMSIPNSFRYGNFSSIPFKSPIPSLLESLKLIGKIWYPTLNLIFSFFLMCIKTRFLILKG